jgi:hypothetical protein
MDRLLHSDPFHQGEARDNDVRILIETPLAIYFTVSEQDCMVTVSAVWRWVAAT